MTNENATPERKLCKDCAFVVDREGIMMCRRWASVETDPTTGSVFHVGLSLAYYARTRGQCGASAKFFALSEPNKALSFPKSSRRLTALSGIGQTKDEFFPESEGQVEVPLGPASHVLPEEGSVWRHHSGRLYTVLFLTNKPDSEKYPLTVVYQGTNGERWSGFLNDWHRRMTWVSNPPPRSRWQDLKDWFW